ncbi:hypothetical protein JW948_13555 [bacterium]|nr:hypothetical protein [bacterium]
MKSKPVFRSLQMLFGGMALVLSMWTAMITGFTLGKSLTILLYADGYRPATYTIEALYFQKANGINRPNRTWDNYYAEGTVEGRKERFGLGSYVQGILKTREDLEAQVQVGQKLAVLYNPDVPVKTQLRVLYPEKKFTETWTHVRNKSIRVGYAPWGICMFLCILFGIAARERRSTLGFVFMGTIFIVFSWMPAILNML